MTEAGAGMSHDLAWLVVETGQAPLHRALYNAVRDAILDGRLPPGTRLPATRTLARELGMSRNTVTAAFEQLAVEGMIESRVGAGTLVSARVQTAVPRSSAAEERSEKRKPLRLSRAGDALATAHRSLSDARQPMPFQPGMPDVSLFPGSRWGRLLARAMRDLAAPDAGYGHPGGFEPLRIELANYLRAARGVQCEPSQVVLFSSAQAALDLMVRMLSEPGGRAWLEEPGYNGARAAFAANGLTVSRIPIDRDGLRVETLSGCDAEPQIGYVTPSHQFPLGATLSMARRVALLDWAEATGSWILEDDYDSEFRYVNRPVAALQGLRSDAPVVFVGSFSKTLFPALRMAYAVVPEGLVAPIRQAVRQTGQEPSFPLQAALSHFIAEGHFNRHLRRMRAHYRARRARLLELFDAYLREFGQAVPADGGLQLTFALAPCLKEQSALAAARELGLGMEGLSRYRESDRAPAGLVFGFGVSTEDDEATMKNLASAWRDAVTRDESK